MAHLIRSPDYDGPDRRNGNGWTSLRAWANAIGIVGIPGAIAIFLVYVGATEIPRIARSLDAVLTQTQQNRDLLRDHMAQSEALIRIAQRNCLNSAKDQNARERCFDK